MSGRLPDPGMGAICGRCGEPRFAHGGPKHMGACPDQSGITARRFSIAAEDRPQPEQPERPERDRLPLPTVATTVTGMDDLARITITRTDYAGIPNEWHVQTEDPPHSTHHRDIDDALLMVRVIMQRIEGEQVQR